MEASAAHGHDTKASTVDTEPAIPSSKRRTRLQFAEGDDARRNNFVVDLGMQMLGDFTDRMLLQEEEKMDSEASSGQAQKILDCVRNMMSGRNPQELFYDWSPPRSLPLEPINSEEVTLSASSTDDTSAVDKVLAGPGCKAWLSDKGAGQGSYLQTTFPTCPVGGLSFCFPGKNRASSQVEIMIAQVKKRESNSVAEKTEEESLRWISLGTVEGSSIPSNKKDAKPCSITLPFIRCCGIKLNLTGFASDNTDKQHGISELSVFRAHPRSVTPSSSTVISAYEEILKNISLCTNSADVIPTMQQCATATAALSSQITLADILLRQREPLSQAMVLSLHNFTKKLQTYCNAQCFRLFEDKSTVGVSKQAKQAKLVGVGNVSIEGDGNIALSRSSGTVAALDYGITEGKLIWEFHLDQDDEESQCSCFGIAKQPVTNCNYESSPHLWMWRAYNGYLYAKGRTLTRQVARIKVRDTIRFELDMDAGTLQGWVNEDDQGILFDGLNEEDDAIYPAVQFYSSGRQVSLLSVQVPTSGSRFASSSPKSSTFSENLLQVENSCKPLSGIPEGAFPKDKNNYFVYVPFSEGDTVQEATWDLPSGEDYKTLSLTSALQFCTNRKTNEVEDGEDFEGLSRKLSSLFNDESPQTNSISCKLYFEVAVDKEVIWTSHSFAIPEQHDEVPHLLRTQTYSTLPEDCVQLLPPGAKSVTLSVRSTRPVPYAVYPVWVTPQLLSSSIRADEISSSPLLLLSLNKWVNSTDSAMMIKHMKETATACAALSGEGYSTKDINETVHCLLQSPQFYAFKILEILSVSSDALLKSRRPTASNAILSSEGCDLELPFILQATGRGFKTMLSLLGTLVSLIDEHKNDAASKLVAENISSVCLIIRANLRHLKCSGIPPKLAEIQQVNDTSCVVSNADFDHGKNSFEEKHCWIHVLSCVTELEEYISRLSALRSRCMETDTSLLQAAIAPCYDLIDDWKEVSGETVEQKLETQFSQITCGPITLIFEFKWPTAVNSTGDDSRIDRVVLLLQGICAREQWRHCVYVAWPGSLFLMVEVPPDDSSNDTAALNSPAFKSVYDFLTSKVNGAFMNANCSPWSFPFGCSDPEVNMKRERVLLSDAMRKEKQTQFGNVLGAGTVHLYTNDIATFDDVQQSVKAFVEAHSSTFEAASHTDHGSTKEKTKTEKEDVSDTGPTTVDPSSGKGSVESEEDIGFFTDSSCDADEII